MLLFLSSLVLLLLLLVMMMMMMMMLLLSLLLMMLMVLLLLLVVVVVVVVVMHNFDCHFCRFPLPRQIFIKSCGFGWPVRRSDPCCEHGTVSYRAVKKRWLFGLQRGFYYQATIGIERKPLEEALVTSTNQPVDWNVIRCFFNMMASEWQLQRGIAIDVHVTGAGPSIWVNDSDLPNLTLMFPIHPGGCSRKRLLFVQSKSSRLIWVSPRSNYPKWFSQVNDQESMFHSHNSLGWVASRKLTSHFLQKVLFEARIFHFQWVPILDSPPGMLIGIFFLKFGIPNPSIYDSISIACELSGSHDPPQWDCLNGS